MPAIEKPSGSPDTIILTLAWLRKNGFKAVPLHPRSKAALSNKYTDKNYTSPDDGVWRKSDLGVGVVTGPAMNGPVDIDLDCPESIFFAQHFLPPTPAVFGRESKKRSHYLYKVDVPELSKQAFIDPKDRSTIIEIRADGGHQTVMPGSIHQDTGEPIQWSDNKVSFAGPEVPVVPIDDLMAGVKKIAVATLVARHMWSEGQRNQVTLHLSGMLFYMGWSLDETVALVKALQEWDKDNDDKSRIATVKLTYKRGERKDKITGATTLKKFLGEDIIVNRIMDWLGSSENNLIQDYNERFATVMLAGHFRVADFDVAKGDPPHFYQKEDFISMMETDRDEEGKPRVRKWLAHPQRRQYWKVAFLPGEESGDGVLNTWTGWAVEPDPDGSCEAWLELLNLVVCGSDDTSYTWILNWFTNMVREPMKRLHTAPVIIGRQGAGKSLMLAYLGRILGSAYTVITNSEHLHGRFNNHLNNTLLLHSEEAVYAGDKRHVSITKSIISDEKRIFERKGVDALQVQNVLRIVLTTNDMYAAPVEPGDRRYTIIDMHDRIASPSLISRVLKEMNGDGPAKLLHFLLNWPGYDPAIARTNLKNDAMERSKYLNMSPVEEWWFETLDSGFILPDYLSWAQRPVGYENPWPPTVASPALYVSFTQRMRDRSVRTQLSEASFFVHLSKMLKIDFDKVQVVYANPMAEEVPMHVKLMSNRMRSIKNMPELEVCRHRFEEYMGQKFTWSRPETLQSKNRRKKDA